MERHKFEQLIQYANSTSIENILGEASTEPMPLVPLETQRLALYTNLKVKKQNIVKKQQTLDEFFKQQETRMCELSYGETN